MIGAHVCVCGLERGVSWNGWTRKGGKPPYLSKVTIDKLADLRRIMRQRVDAATYEKYNIRENLWFNHVIVIYVHCICEQYYRLPLIIVLSLLTDDLGNRGRLGCRDAIRVSSLMFLSTAQNEPLDLRLGGGDSLMNSSWRDRLCRIELWK